MVGSKAKRTFIERTSKRIIWITDYKEDGKVKQGVRVVWLRPPDRWDLDTCGDSREVGEYKLTPNGENNTRLDMKSTLTYDSKDDVEDRKKWEKDVDEEWNTFASYLEKDYKEAQHASKQ
jgi:hypothetical protein